MQKAPEAQPLEPKHLGPIETLVFQNVAFKHQTAGQKAIDDISFTAKNGFETPNSPEKWGAQVGGGIASFAFGKVTDNHLAGEKGGPFVGGFFKAVVETGSNAAPNLVKE